MTVGCRTSDGFSAVLLAGLPSAVVVTEADGTIVCWNRQAELLYGYAADDVLGAAVSGLGIGPADADEARAVTRSVLTDGCWAGEYDTRRFDGSRIRISARFASITDVDRGFSGFVGVSVAATARVRQVRRTRPGVRVKHRLTKQTGAGRSDRAS